MPCAHPLRCSPWECQTRPHVPAARPRPGRRHCPQLLGQGRAPALPGACAETQGTDRESKLTYAFSARVKKVTTALPSPWRSSPTTRRLEEQESLYRLNGLDRPNAEGVKCQTPDALQNRDVRPGVRQGPGHRRQQGSAPRSPGNGDQGARREKRNCPQNSAKTWSKWRLREGAVAPASDQTRDGQ